MELQTPFINAPISFLYSMMQSVNKNRFGKKNLKIMNMDPTNHKNGIMMGCL